MSSVDTLHTRSVAKSRQARQSKAPAAPPWLAEVASFLRSLRLSAHELHNACAYLSETGGRAEGMPVLHPADVEVVAEIIARATGKVLQGIEKPLPSASIDLTPAPIGSPDITENDWAEWCAFLHADDDASAAATDRMVSKLVGTETPNRPLADEKPVKPRPRPQAAAREFRASDYMFSVQTARWIAHERRETHHA